MVFGIILFGVCFQFRLAFYDSYTQVRNTVKPCLQISIVSYAMVFVARGNMELDQTLSTLTDREIALVYEQFIT